MLFKPLAKFVLEESGMGEVRTKKDESERGGTQMCVKVESGMRVNSDLWVHLSSGVLAALFPILLLLSLPLV